MSDGMFKDTMVNMNWRDIQNAADNNALVLMPIGVIEEHGPHLCLGTDIYTAHIHCLFIKEKLEKEGRRVMIAPPFYWGVCQSTGGFIGSFQIRKETATALLFDILSSLAGFGFKNIFGINGHGDIEQSIAIIEAFRAARNQLDINARYAFDEQRLEPFGLEKDAPYLCVVRPSDITTSSASVWDVHGGDIETAIIHHFYPHLVDEKKAKSLPPVALAGENANDWLFGGHIKELSPLGYLGAPAEYESADIIRFLDDYAWRVSETILMRVAS